MKKHSKLHATTVVVQDYLRQSYKFVRSHRFNPRLIRHFDWMLFILVVALSLFGTLAIYAATAIPITETSITVRDALTTQPSSYALKHIGNFAFGLLAMFGMMYFSYEYYHKWARIIYIANIAVLVAVLFVEVGRGGMTAFFKLGSSTSSSQRSLQPSEFGKIAIIIALSRYLSDRSKPIRYPKEVLELGLYVGIPTVLVLLQPDFGTALVYVAITAVLLFISGTDWKMYVGIIALLIVVCIPLWHYMNASENSFRLTRILIWLDPESYPDEARQIINGQIALGSGGLTGKGMFSPGSFASLGYISDDHTDFCFAIVGEAFGFIGTFGVAFGFALLLGRLTYISYRTTDTYGRYLVAGVLAMFTFHIVENISMVIGLLPVTGIPLPFISYGGSNMVTNMMGIGLVMNVVMRSRYKGRETRSLHTAAL